MSLSLQEFVKRWKINALTERSGSQSHFIDLCEMLGLPHPAAADAVGERYTFDKPVSKVYGGKGFADVWLRDHFAWEYKGKHKDLKAAYKQINDYREDLGNPPLLVVCDLDRFQVHTNFTATQKRIYEFNLDDLGRNAPTATCPLPPLEVLRALFGDTGVLRPDRTDAHVTQEAAKVFARLAERLEIEKRANTETPVYTKEEIAHFLMRLLFCLFADAVGLLPGHLFRSLIQGQDRFLPKRFLRKLRALFDAMSNEDREFDTFGEHTIKYFNGGLFDSSSVIKLDTTDLGILYDVSKNYNWAHVAPEIFGTLFERSLNAERRSLIGAHYTSAADILLLIEPVLMRPLRRRWDEVKVNVLATLEAERAQAPANSLLKSTPKAEAALSAWIDELTSVRVLDPACGSGNFLYLALRNMLDLWLEAQTFAAEHDISLVLPKMVSPSQLYGIEIEFYAHELASIVVWIGFLQWKHEHGVHDDREPILQKLDNIQHADAILRYDKSDKSEEFPNGRPYEPQWPEADYIIGNPPFLGGKLLRRELGDRYVDDLFALYKGRVKAEADLVVYWFEKARVQIESRIAQRVGLLATQGIRGGANRTVLDRIQQTGNIFWAWSDRNWLLQGATVHVSMIGFDGGSETLRILNDETVSKINPNLTSEIDVTTAHVLSENVGLCFMGTTKVGPFEINESTAKKMLLQPINPNGRPNSDVVKPWANARDFTQHRRNMYIVDFGVKMPEAAAALYEMPFEYVKEHVKPKRKNSNRDLGAKPWWIHGRARPELRGRIRGLDRYILTPGVSKFRLFDWRTVDVLPDHALFAFPRQDDYFMGVLHSAPHERWSRAKGTQLREVESGFRYTPNSTFDTFPFPWPPGTEPSEADDPRVRAIADAARELVRLRDTYLNPLDSAGQPLPESELKDRTLTKLYNKRPEWLANAHRTLDRAVFAAYGWPDDLSDQEILARLLALNHERAAAQKVAAKPS